jgi:hypothetical protein
MSSRRVTNLPPSGRSPGIATDHVREAARLLREKVAEGAVISPSTSSKVLDAGELRELHWRIDRNGEELENLGPALREVENERSRVSGAGGVDLSTGAYNKAIGRLLGRVVSVAKRDGDAASVSWTGVGRLDTGAKWLALLASELSDRDRG